MSESGQSRRFDGRQTTAGLPPETDIVTAGWHASKVPAADSCAAPLSSRHYPVAAFFSRSPGAGKNTAQRRSLRNPIGCFSLVRWCDMFFSHEKLQPVSFRPDVGCSHDLGPCLGFFDNELREVGRRAYKRLAA